MLNIIPLLVISSGSVFFATFFNKKYEEILPITVLSIIVLLYFSYIFNILNIGFSLIIILSILLYVFSFIRMIKKKIFRQTINNIFTPGLLCFLIIFIIITIITKNSYVGLWDELRLWGAYLKLLFYDSSVQITNGTMFYDTMKSYLPSMPLFQYFWMKCIGTFVESYLFLSYSVVFVSLFMPLLKKITWSKWWKILIIIPIVILIPLTFYNSGFDSGYFYSTLYIDPILGIFFGVAMYLAMSNIFKDKLKYIFFMLVIASLTLFKDSGILFSIMSIITAGLNYLISKKNKIDKQFIIKIIILLTIPILLLISWKIFKTNYGIVNLLANPINLKSIFSFIFSPTEEQFFVFKKFVKYILRQPLITTRLLNPEITHLFSYLFFMTFYFVFGLKLIPKIDKKNKKSFIITTTMIFVTTIIFTISLLFLSVLSFNNTSSFQRYINTTMIGVLIYYVLIILKYNFYKINKNYIKIIIFIVLSSIIIFPFYKTNLNQSKYEKYQLSIIESKKIFEIIDNKNKRTNIFIFGNSKVSSNSLLHHQIYFRLIDKNIFVKNFYTETYPDKDFSSFDEFKKYLIDNNYQYIYVMNYEEYGFINNISKETNSKIENNDIIEIENINGNVKFQNISK